MPNPRRRRTRFVLKQTLSAVGIDPATLYRESGATIDAVIKAIPVARPAEARGQSGDMAFLQGGGLRTLAGGVNINGAGIFASGEADFTDVDPATYAHYYFGSPTTKLSPHEDIFGFGSNGWGDLGADGPGGHAALYTPNGPVQPYVAKYGSAIGFPYSDLCKGGVAACTASQTATFYIGGFFSLPTGLTGGLGHTFLNTSGSGRMFLDEDNCMYDLIETRTWTTGNVPRTILIFTGTLAPLNADNIYNIELQYFDSVSNSHKFVYTAATSSLYTGVSADSLTSSYTFFSGTTAQDAALNFAKALEASLGNDAGFTDGAVPQNKASWQMTKVYVSGSSDWQFGPLGDDFSAGSAGTFTPAGSAVVEIYDGDQNPLNKSTIGRKRLATVTVTGSAPKLFNGATSNSAIWSISASYASAEEASGIPATSSPTEFSCSLPGFGDNGLSCTTAVVAGNGIYTTAYQWAGSGSMGSDYLDCVRVDTLTGSVPSNAIVAMQYVLDVSASSMVTAEAMAAAATEIIPGACVWITGSATTGSGLFARNMQLKSCIDV